MLISKKIDSFLIVAIAIICCNCKKTVSAPVINPGSGEEPVYYSPDLSGLKDGDTLVVPKAVYSGGLIKNDNKKIFIDGSKATFKGTIEGMSSNIIFHGFSFKDFDDVCFKLYSDDTVVYENVKILNCSASNVTVFVFTNWGGPESVRSKTKNLEVAFCTIDKTHDYPALFLWRSFDVNIHHNKFTNIGIKTDTSVHSGVIHISGDGRIYNNYQSNTHANFVRGWGAGLNERGTLEVFNNIVVNNTKYAAVECNQNEVSYGSSNGFDIQEADYDIHDNTFGNLAPSGYQSAGVCIYKLKSGRVNFSKNIVFNTSKGLIHFDGDEASIKQTVESGNFYFPTAEAAGVTLSNGTISTASIAFGKAGAPAFNY